MSNETSEVVTPAIEALNKIPGTFAWRINSGRVQVRGGWIHLAPDGMPDIGVVLNGRAMFVECKRSAKDKLRESQKEMALVLGRAGALVVRANSAAEAVSILLKEMP